MSSLIEHSKININGSPDLPKPAVILEDVTVQYQVPQEKIHTFKEFAIRYLQGKIQYTELLALNRVSLTVNKGEIFGLIGPNGAGKTTLLRLVARVIRPTSGRVIVHGVVAPLLAMGAGFHYDLTGRENVYLNGAILGLTRQQITELFDWIVDFSEMREFIDAPLRTYSSGMVARLGFAVATAIMPDILIVDEVLSVGDISFQEKCNERIRQFQESGATILYVSHNMASMRAMCHRVAWIHKGHLVEVGTPDEVVTRYEQSTA